MRKYEVYCCGVLVYVCDTLIEAIVHFKHFAKKFGLDSVDILTKEDDIKTIRIIISQEV